MQYFDFLNNMMNWYWDKLIYISNSIDPLLKFLIWMICFIILYEMLQIGFKAVISFFKGRNSNVNHNLMVNYSNYLLDKEGGFDDKPNNKEPFFTKILLKLQHRWWFKNNKDLEFIDIFEEMRKREEYDRAIKMIEDGNDFEKGQTQRFYKNHNIKTTRDKEMINALKRSQKNRI